jgi:hypothetical protein
MLSQQKLKDAFDVLGLEFIYVTMRHAAAPYLVAFEAGLSFREPQAPQGLFPGLRITRWSKSCSCPDGRSSVLLHCHDSPPMHL